jgi:hypothetical protein
MDEKQAMRCDLTAIPAAVRRQHLASIPAIFQAVQEVRELPDGYALRFANEPGRFMALANYVEYERLCCSFLQYGIEIEPHGGPIWLRLSGGQRVKEALAAVWSENNCVELPGTA